MSRVLLGKSFAGADRLRRFLSYVVEQHLDGKADRLKELTIGMVVFDRADFDPAKDSIVRNTAARLRRELDGYYESEGKNDPIVITIPRGRYVPRFAIRVSTTSSPVRNRSRSPTVVAAALTALIVFSLRPPPPRTGAVARAVEPWPRRLLAPATSEGRSPVRIRTPHTYGGCWISADGKRLYALHYPGRDSVTIFGTDRFEVERDIALPGAVRFLRIAAGGELLIGATGVGRVIGIETATGRVNELVKASAPVFDAAITPDRAKLFLAMGYSGLRRVNLKTGENTVLSSIACPTNVKLDPAGKFLFVGYECGGPGGRPGHDTVDVYDARTERSVHIIGGELPMVGGRQAISPNSEIVLLSGGNACEQPNYDHLGCETVPSQVFHVWRASGRTTILSRSFDMGGAAHISFFPDGDRVFLHGKTVTVWNWARNVVHESLSLPGTGASVMAPSGDRVYVLSAQDPELLVFDAEKESCLPPRSGLQNFYFADGTTDDSIASASFSNRRVDFVPGRFGQAFRFDGKTSFLRTSTGAAWCPDCWQEWSVSLFVKFQPIVQTEDMTVLCVTDTPLGSSLRLYRSRDGHIVLATDVSQFPAESSSPVKGEEWYHISVAVRGDRTSLYVNGALQGRLPVGFPLRIEAVKEMVFLGSDRGERRYLRGLIDEVAVYNRELSSQEVGMLSSPCSVSSP